MFNIDFCDFSEGSAQKRFNRFYLKSLKSRRRRPWPISVGKEVNFGFAVFELKLELV